jgi:hypothetical protein
MNNIAKTSCNKGIRAKRMLLRDSTRPRRRRRATQQMMLHSISPFGE